VPAVGVCPATLPTHNTEQRRTTFGRTPATAKKMAEVLKVSLDYLVGFAEHELDHSLTQKIIDIQKLNDEDKNSILNTIDALLRDAKARKAYA
jgi:hypothetical protein